MLDPNKPSLLPTCRRATHRKHTDDRIMSTPAFDLSEFYSAMEEKITHNTGVWGEYSETVGKQSEIRDSFITIVLPGIIGSGRGKWCTLKLVMNTQTHLLEVWVTSSIAEQYILWYTHDLATDKLEICSQDAQLPWGSDRTWSRTPPLPRKLCMLHYPLDDFAYGLVCSSDIVEYTKDGEGTPITMCTGERKLAVPNSQIVLWDSGEM